MAQYLRFINILLAICDKIHCGLFYNYDRFVPVKECEIIDEEMSF